MDFIDELRSFSTRALKLKDIVATEEATKNSLILPFFQLLGYDVFNPLEFIPEFTADVGTKKGEKVDFAIMLNEEPAILIEAKWAGATLEKHDSQLFRYFGTTTAKFGILTNGIFYKFYTDLNEQNKMDLEPFLEFSVLDIPENLVPEIKRFSKATLDIEAATIAASELKYTNLLKSFIHAQRSNPSDNFAKFMIGEVYKGRITQPTLERFRPVIKRALNQYIGDAINYTLKSAIKNQTEADESQKADEVEVPEEIRSTINTTQEELEAFGVIKGLLHDIIDPTKLSHKDTEYYFGVLYDNKTTKWICRLKLDGKKKTIIFPPIVEPPYDKETRHTLVSINDLYAFKDVLALSAKRFV